MIPKIQKEKNKKSMFFSAAKFHKTVFKEYIKYNFRQYDIYLQKAGVWLGSKDHLS